MNWLTRNQLDYAPIIRLRDTDARYLQADAECSLRTRRARVSVRPLSEDQYHPTWEESRLQMLARWRTAT